MQNPDVREPIKYALCLLAANGIWCILLQPHFIVGHGKIANSVTRNSGATGSEKSFLIKKSSFPQENFKNKFSIRKLYLKRVGIEFFF